MKYFAFGSNMSLKQVSLSNENKTLHAVTYYASNIDDSLLPYTWYKKHVLLGAQEMNLPTEYIRRIEAVEALEDSNLKRHEKEMAIYSGKW